MRRPQYHGFTLIEVMATVVVLGVIATIASKTVLVAMNGYLQASTQAQLHIELASTMDRIDRELRKIPIKTSYASVAPDISAVTASSIAWSGNYSLSLSGSQLMLTDNGATSALLLGNVTAFSVQTYDEANTALAASLSGTACDPIRRIRISITVQRSGITESLRTKIFLRNTLDGAAP